MYELFNELRAHVKTLETNLSILTDIVKLQQISIRLLSQEIAELQPIPYYPTVKEATTND
jgi:predicted transcriptional regulator